MISDLIFQIIHYLFLGYTILIMIRVIGSWFPNFSRYRVMNLVSSVTDPYLNFFRRIIPPIGGRLDLSPILGFFALEFIQRFVLISIKSLF